jgi:hypothetical protein
MSPEATQDPFEYDVAFSFLASDEAIAIELNDLISERLRTFLYSERQLELAGTDGVETFTRVFREQARSVVVLYREGWGETPWTRVEATAIRDRAHHEGFDFALFVSLDGTKPIWLPQNRLWIGLERWGPKAAAAVIERRASELGSGVRQESLVDRSKRLQRSLQAKSRRDTFNREGESGATFRAHASEVQARVEAQIAELKAAGSPINYVCKRDGHALLITGAVAGLRIGVDPGYDNVLDSWTLEVQITRGHPRLSTGLYFEEPPRPLVQTNYTAVGGDDLGFRWLEKRSQDQAPLSSDHVAERAVRLLLDYIEKLANEKPR